VNKELELSYEAYECLKKDLQSGQWKYTAIIGEKIGINWTHVTHYTVEEQ
jgi:hypothetical protein